jgi:transposase
MRAWFKIAAMPPEPTLPIPQPATLEEAQELIKALWLKLLEQSKVIEEQGRRIKELEEKLNTNSRNSSRPPSTDKGPGKKKSGSGKKAGGQPGHTGKGRALFTEEQIDRTQSCYPNRQCECGGAVNTTRLGRRHQTIDIPEIKPFITEYRLYAGVCRGCGKQHEAGLPAGVSAKLVGPRLLALIGTLTGGYRLSKRLVQGLLQDLYRIELSVGTISESEEIISAALETVVQEAHEHIQRAAVVHSDETGHKEKGKKQWMWVGIAGLVSVFLARASRSAEIAKELLGEAFAGILISDRYSAYTWVEALRRQLCWAHLLRDFTKIAQRSGTAGQVGAQLIEHTKRMFRYWHQVRDGTLSRDCFAHCMTHIQTGMESALQRGIVCGESKTANTCKGLLKVKAALWTFVHTQGVEPTNNLAERTIRSYVIWRKTSFGTQSKRGSLYMERMMTTVGSCKLQGRNILEFVTQAVGAYIANGIAPSLVPARVG